MGKAVVRPGWSVYWPPASSQQQIYGPGEIVEFEGEAPQIAALEVLPEPKPVPAPDPPVSSSYAELKAFAKAKGIEGYAKMSKDELIDALTSLAAQEGGQPDGDTGNDNPDGSDGGTGEPPASDPPAE
jgi:hypothetical protein